MGRKEAFWPLVTSGPSHRFEKFGVPASVASPIFFYAVLGVHACYQNQWLVSEEHPIPVQMQRKISNSVVIFKSNDYRTQWLIEI